MARFTAVLLALLLLAAPALADLPLPEMATEDLIALRDAISLELAARSASPDALAAWDTATAHVELLSVTQSLSPECDQEAMRVLGMMPKWKPGIQHDQPCRTKVCIPIVFKL